VTATLDSSNPDRGLRLIDALRTASVVGVAADLDPRSGVLRSVTVATAGAALPFALEDPGAEVEILRGLMEGSSVKVGRGLQPVARALMARHRMRPANLRDLGVGEVLASGYQRAGAAGGAAAPTTACQALNDAPRVTAAVDAAGVTAIWDLENQLLVPVAAVENAGVGVDLNALERVLHRRRGEKDSLAAWLRSALGVRRPDDASEVERALRRLGVDRDQDGAASPDHAIVVCLERFRTAVAQVHTLERVRSFVGPDRRVRTRFNSLASPTGRMSSSSPDLHSIPRDPDIRACFVPAPGWVFVRADYDALELRVAAEVLREPNLMTAFVAGDDPHVQTAALLLDKDPSAVSVGERQLAKAVNYGLVFGQGARSFRSYARSRFGLRLTMEDADGLRGRFLDRFPVLAAWHRQVARREPRFNTVRTVGGRLRRFPRFDYCAYLNSPIQGTAADGMKRAVVELDRRIDDTGGHIVHLIHDEVLVEVPASEAPRARILVEAAMIEGMATYVKAVPVVVKAAIVTSWAGGRTGEVASCE
jgi:hypothetical protein